VKKRLLQQFTNMGQPVIEVTDDNFENRGELYLVHRHEGVNLREDFARRHAARTEPALDAAGPRRDDRRRQPRAVDLRRQGGGDARAGEGGMKAGWR